MNKKACSTMDLGARRNAQMGIKMNNISIILPVIGAIGFILIIAILLIIRGLETREKIKSADAAKFTSFAEEIRRENAEIKKDLQTVVEKVEAIDTMMKDI